MADSAFRHVGSALARLVPGGRLVAITGISLAPDNPSWREDFVRLQARGRVVFSAGIDRRVYARQGTAVETRLTVIDRVPAEDPTVFPPCPGIAPDAATLLEWVTRLVPPRLALSAPQSRRPPPARCPRARSSRARIPSRSVTRTRRSIPAPHSSTRSARNRRPSMAASAMRSTKATPSRPSPSLARSRIRRSSCNPQPWPRSRHRAPATGRIYRRRSCSPACSRMRRLDLPWKSGGSFA